MRGKGIYIEGAVIHQGLSERDSRGSLDQVVQGPKRQFGEITKSRVTTGVARCGQGEQQWLEYRGEGGGFVRGNSSCFMLFNEHLHVPGTEQNLYMRNLI